MHKRKVAGILQYGNRLGYNKVIKLQEGGHVAVSEGYDWREDPYELMLLQQKAAKDNAKLRYSAKNAKAAAKTTKPVKSILGAFDPIKGGLKGSRTAAQAEGKALVDGFYDLVKQNGREWLYTDEATQVFDQVQTGLSNINEGIKNEKEEFDKLRDGISEDSLSAKAIATNGFAFVTDPTGKNPDFIHVSKFYADPDKYKIRTISDFIDWKSSTDTSRSNKIASIFLGDNALGDNDLRDTYIKNRGEVQFKIDKGMVVATENHASVDAGQDIGSVEQVMRGVNSILSGKEVEDSKMGTEELGILKDVINDVTTSVYGSEIANDTRLRASLLSQAVQHTGIMKHMKELPVEERDAYMNKALGALWVDKIISKNYPGKPGSGSNQDGSPASPKAKTDAAGGALASMFDSPFKEQFTQGAILKVGGREVSTTYDYDKTEEENVYRMMSVKYPARTNVIKVTTTSNEDATEDEKRNNFIGHNSDLDTYLDMNNIFTMDGSSLQSVMTEDISAADFARGKAVVKPGSSMDMVALLVDGQGEPIHAYTDWMNDSKLEARRSFIKAFNKFTAEDGVKSPYRAEDLISAAKDTTGYNAYAEWIDSGLRVDKFKKFYESEKKKHGVSSIAAHNAKRAYNMAEAASEVIGKAQKDTKNFSGRHKGAQMKMFGVFTAIYDDTHDLDGIDKNIVKKAKSKKFGSGAIRDISGGEGFDLIQEFHDVEDSYFIEDMKEVKFIAPLKPLEQRSAEKGTETWPQRNEVKNIEDELMGGLNIMSALTNQTEKNVAHLLL